MDNNPILIGQRADAQAKFITTVYAWMAGALALTGLTSLYAVSNESIMQLIASNKIFFYALIFGELGLVIYLSAAINRMSAQTAMMAFLIYAVLNGLTFSVLFMIYTAGSIASTFFITAGTFGAMSAYGYFTKTDLTKVGNIAFMGLIGIIIASIVNFFLKSEMLYWITSFIGVAVFVGLTAYDTQKIKAMSEYQDADTESGQKMAIMGALTLYLDFINLFLMLLRLFGSRK